MRYTKLSHVVLMALLFFIGLMQRSAAQGAESVESTGAWFLVKPSSLPFPVNTGVAYVSLQVLDTEIYQDDNTWTNLLARNRCGFVEVSVSGTTLANIAFTDAKSSQPVAIQKNKKLVGISFAPLVMSRIPLCFKSLEVVTTINRTSEDKLDDLISAAGTLSTSLPQQTMSAATTNSISASKALLDIIFQKQLSSIILESDQSILTASSLLAPGVYVLFSSQKATDYDGYVRNPAGPSGLNWDGSSLNFGQSQVKDVSYIVLDLEYAPRMFPDATLPDSALNCGKPWATLYKNAISDIQGINDPNNYTSELDAIRKDRIDGNTLLEQDADYIVQDQNAIEASVEERINDQLAKRLADLRAALPQPNLLGNLVHSSSASAVPSPAVTPSPVTNPVASNSLSPSP